MPGAVTRTTVGGALCTWFAVVCKRKMETSSRAAATRKAAWVKGRGVAAGRMPWRATGVRRRPVRQPGPHSGPPALPDGEGGPEGSWVGRAALTTAPGPSRPHGRARARRAPSGLRPTAVGPAMLSPLILALCAFLLSSSGIKGCACPVRFLMMTHNGDGLPEAWLARGGGRCCRYLRATV